MVKKSETIIHGLKFTRLLDGFVIFNYALSGLDLHGKVKVSVNGSTHTWNEKTQELETNLSRIKLQTLRQVIESLPIISTLKCDDVEILVSFNQESGKFELRDSAEEEETIPQIVEVIAPSDLVVEVNQALPLDVTTDSVEVLTVSESSADTFDFDKFNLFIAVRNTEKKLMKKRIEFTNELEELVKGWLAVNRHSIQPSEHNALVIYPYPAYEFVVMMVKGVPQVRKRPLISENLPEVRSRNRTTIEKTGKPPIPEIANLLLISPIKEETNDQIYITQIYIEKDSNGKYTRKRNRIAWFDKLAGNLGYFIDLKPAEKIEHSVYPLVTVGGSIYPDLSIKEINLENLIPDSVNWNKDDESKQFWVTETEELAILTTGDRVAKNQLTSTSRLKKVAGNSRSISPKSIIPSITFHGLKHPNIEEVKTPQHQRLVSNKVKPYLLDGSKAVSGQLVFNGMLGTVPCIFKMVPSGRLYDIQALPIKCNQIALATYILGNFPRLTSTAYLERVVEKYQNMKVKLDKQKEKEELVTKLETLLREVNSGMKLDPSDVLAATKIIEKYLDKAEYKPITGDSYYRFHNLGTGQFIQQISEEKYQYLVTDYGKNYRRGTGSDINSVINWVRNCPHNLNEKFGHKGAEINEISLYLEKSFYDRFSKKSLQLVIYERGQKFLEIWHKGELEIKQLITIVSPSNNDKKTSLMSTETNFKLEGGSDSQFQQFLQCSEIKEAPLLNATKLQVQKMVQKYIRSNYLALTGKNNVFKETKISSMVGYNSSLRGYGQIVKTFLKYVRPYLEQSAFNVGKGELISLNTLETQNEKDANNLIGAMSSNWKHWEHKDNETITLGESVMKKPDPGVLMLAVTAVINQTPQHGMIIWRDLIDVFYQLSKHSLGFRASNGVILTPHHFYDSGVTRHTHRIKLQLIDLLMKEQRRKQESAKSKLAQSKTAEQKKQAMEQVELLKVTNSGSIEAGLSCPVSRLYSNLEESDPRWKINLANPDILKHLAAMESALIVATKAEQTF